MKKLFTLLLMCTLVVFSASTAFAANGDLTTNEISFALEQTTQATTPDMVPLSSTDEGEETMQELLKRYFIDGDWRFMSIVLVCLILGLALCIERILALNLATTNANKLLQSVESALQEGDLEKAKEVARSTRGPVASIFYQGLDRVDDGIDIVEKSIVSYGSVQMGQLERGMVWISLFIALAPMLGFMGTVIGMISAFDSIQQAGDISPSLVAGGIKVALLTTVFGLIVAIILQIFYNYILSKLDSIVNTMEDASISLVDLLTKYNVAKRNPSNG